MSESCFQMQIKIVYIVIQDRVVVYVCVCVGGGGVLSFFSFYVGLVLVSAI